MVDPLTLNSHNLRLFCLCYFPDSQIALQPDVLWQYDRRTVARLFLALISAADICRARQAGATAGLVTGPAC
ncbi:hypothetical protein F8E82_26275 [Salmonella enterica]|nr:hypothetical protein [Salmonella enterica]